MVQSLLGGHQTSISAIAGGIAGSIFGPWGVGTGFLLGTMMDVGDMGIAGRTINGAHNKDATQYAHQLFGNHGALYKSQDIWTNIVKEYIKN